MKSKKRVQAPAPLAVPLSLPEQAEILGGRWELMAATCPPRLTVSIRLVLKALASLMTLAAPTMTAAALQHLRESSARLEAVIANHQRSKTGGAR